MIKLAHPVEGMLNVSMEKLRDMIDVDTIIGKPISAHNGLITIIPVSKVSFGFGSGGSDFPTKSASETFGGGAGGGVSIKPLAFLVIKVDEVKLLQIDDSDKGFLKLINSAPEMFSKLSGMFKHKKDNSKSESKK